MKKKPLLQKLTLAKTELGEAEADLEKILREAKISVRAEKAMIDKVLTDALSKLKLANTNLLAIEKLVERDKS